MNRIGIISTLIASLISGCGTVEEQKTTVNNTNSTVGSEETWYYGETNNNINSQTQNSEIIVTPNENNEKENQISNNEQTENNTQIENNTQTEINTEKENNETTTELVYDHVETPAQPTETSSLVGYNDKKSWWFRRNSDHLPPSAQMDINISQYDAYYLGDTQHKVIYLTFDEGYENGYTPQILDILKANDVKAAFFVTKDYIERNPELIKRMVDEGHVVGNHSVTHSDMPDLSDEQIKSELDECAAYFKEVTGVEMPRFFRPPAGVYSIRSLEKTQQAGYKTIFWSFAYKDWETDNQPGKEEAYNMVMNNYHNGSIMLLHAVSQSNTEALDDMLKSLKQEGYTFLSLYDLP